MAGGWDGTLREAPFEAQLHPSLACFRSRLGGPEQPVLVTHGPFLWQQLGHYCGSPMSDLLSSPVIS